MADQRRDHPGPAAVAVPPAIRDAIVAQARAEYPNESCGVIVGDAPAVDGGAALRYVATRNVKASPFRYEIDPIELLHLNDEVDNADEVFWGIVHSHTHTPAVPSPTDIGMATIYVEPLYLLVSLDPDQADPVTGGPGLRAWRIVEGQTFEVGIR
ncbi:MAG TPA: M67 family metallopeptidase [Candidatus Limnocylindrales bacterium]